MREWFRCVLVLGVLVLVGCGGDDDSSSATLLAAETAPAVTSLPETTTPTTTVETTTPTTVRATTTTVSDPLTAALTAAGFDPPTDELRQSLETLCASFSAGDAEAINSSAGRDAQVQEFVRVGFGVLCPENEAAVGSAVMPSGEAVFEGYPRIVDVGTIDSRVASWFEGKLVDGQVVALAPGVYAPFNPSVPDLYSYLTGPNDGDCVMREQHFPASGGACWTGVQAGSAEQ